MKPLSELKHLLPENPPGTPEGHYWTMNNMGTCEDFLDELTQAFVDYAKGKNVLDIGSGYGTAAICALENGANMVIANDLIEEHLNIAGDRTDKELILAPRDFLRNPIGPLDRECLCNRLDAILLNKVIHILDPRFIQFGFANLYDLLKEGGKLFIKSMTPYSKSVLPHTREAAEERERNNKAFPGYFEKSGVDGAPEKFNLFTVRELRKTLEIRDFIVEQCKYIPAHIESMRGDFGKDYVMAIARK